MLFLDYQDRRPIYEQIVEKFRMLILSGAVEPSSKMPSVRQLAVELSINPNTIQRAYMELEQQGLIQAFEFTHELSWKVMKDYFAYQGQTEIMGSRDATRAAFAVQLIEDGEGWMEMIRSRNQTSHTYNEEVANEIAARITGQYAPLFQAFLLRMQVGPARSSTARSMSLRRPSKKPSSAATNSGPTSSPIRSSTKAGLRPS